MEQQEYTLTTKEEQDALDIIDAMHEWEDCDLQEFLLYADKLQTITQ